MTQNDDAKYYFCPFCNYTSARKYNIMRHQSVKHYNIRVENDKNIKREENVTLNKENVTPNEKNVIPNEKNVIPNYICKKCNKIYKIKKSFLEHKKKCNGLDDLTCPRCMITFTNRHNKSRHIAKNNCEPRSIIYAKKNENKDDNVKTNITNNNYITNNNITNNIIHTNNIYINNYGNERIDYLNYEKMLEIFKKVYDIPTSLTKEIHFNINFPENNNIIYKNKNTSLVKSDNDFILKDLNNLVQELITEKTKLMQKFAIENKDDICLKIDTYLYEEIIEQLLNLILLKEPSEHYKNQVINIREIIKNSNKI